MKTKRTVKLNVLEKGALLVGTTMLVNKWNKQQKIKRERQRLIKSVERKISRATSNKKTCSTPRPGQAVGLLSLPTYKKTYPIIEGDRPKDLERGVGHHRRTAWPGENKQIFLSGHRQTDFGILKKIVVGDPVEIKMPEGTYVYHVTKMKVVNEKDTGVIDAKTNFASDQVVLMTCYPFTLLGGTKKRYLVYAE